MVMPFKNIKFIGFWDILGFRVVLKWNEQYHVNEGYWYGFQIWKRGTNTFNRFAGWLVRPDGTRLGWKWAKIA